MIENKKLKASLSVLRAITHPIRLSILSFIDENKVVQVNKIFSTLNLNQSITSQHLAILRNTKLVHTKRRGKFIYYSVNYDRITEIKESTENLFGY